MADYEKLLQKFLKEIKGYNPRADVKPIQKAYLFAQEQHKNQKRESGEAYFSHTYEVARKMVELRADSATICAALLHDVVEDSSVSLETIQKEFGKEIAEIVEGLTKIKKVKFEEKSDYTIENLRKILLATAKDIRVMLIKLADRLHNMRTVQHLPEDRQNRMADETLQIYAPIAHKLGMSSMKGELEDLSLKVLDPEAYNMLEQKIIEGREERQKRTKEFIDVIKKKLKENKIEAKIYGRAKYFYSIYRKMQEQHKDFSEIYDLLAIRIIVRTIPGCYAALGIVHDLFKPIPKKFKDYISVPKANGYQSLHTSVVGAHGKILEIQIRTWDMHHMAEEGIAAHWRYKGTERDKKFDRKIAWLKQLLEWKQESKTAKDFIETLKIDLWHNEIVVFTPKGDPISLPEGSTPVDFAYEVHSSIGDHCSKAEVNGKIVPLDYPLKSGDIIKIITQNNAKPSRNWLTFVKTSKARSKIRQKLGIPVEHDPTIGRVKEARAAQKNLLDLITIKDKKQQKLQLKLSKCCSPTYKSPIVAFVTKDGKITIHKKSCSNIHALGENKPVEISWVEEGRNVEKIRATVQDRVGMLADILDVISGAGINIAAVHTKSKKGRVNITFKLEMPEDMEIKTILQKIQRLDGVLDVKHLKGWMVHI